MRPYLHWFSQTCRDTGVRPCHRPLQRLPECRSFRDETSCRSRQCAHAIWSGAEWTPLNPESLRVETLRIFLAWGIGANSRCGCPRVFHSCDRFLHAGASHGHEARRADGRNKAIHRRGSCNTPANANSLLRGLRLHYPPRFAVVMEQFSDPLCPQASLHNAMLLVCLPDQARGASGIFIRASRCARSVSVSR
jgi:hypothetical protein